MDKKLKAHIISAINTFIATFVVVFSTMVANTETIDSSFFIAASMSAGVAGLRAVSKIVLEQTK